MKNTRKHLLQIALALALTSGLVLPASADCARFEDCLRQTLNSSEPLERAMSASQGIALWNKSLPQRDLVNLIQMRAEALIALHISGKSSERLLKQIESDYLQLKTLLPTSWMPPAGLGRLAELQGKPALAETFYAESLKSRELPGFLARAEYWLRRQDPEKALRDLDAGRLRLQELIAREADIHPQHRGRLHLLRAQALRELKREFEAQLELESACKIGLSESCPP